MEICLKLTFLSKFYPVISPVMLCMLGYLASGISQKIIYLNIYLFIHKDKQFLFLNSLNIQLRKVQSFPGTFKFYCFGHL